MEELSKEHKMFIEEYLYGNVRLILESQYNIEGNIDISKKSSSKMIFKDKKKAIIEISREIERFADKNNVDKEIVKNYLLSIIENRIDLNNIHKAELKEVKRIVLEYGER